MGKLDKISINTRVVAPVLGCSQREDCKAETLPLELFESDLHRIDQGLEPEYGVTLEIALADRVTFMATCMPETCAKSGECALRGTFVDTTPEMIAAQDR